jgi:hypothetical protein
VAKTEGDNDDDALNTTTSYMQTRTTTRNVVIVNYSQSADVFN